MPESFRSRGQVGGGGGLAGVRPDRLQLGGEDPVGAELALDRHGGSDVRRTHQHREVGQRHHQHAEHPVGAVDQREALLGGELDRRQAGRGQRLGGRQQRRRAASRTWPSPISASAQCESGARSPEQPSEPYSWTTGVMPALSIAAISSRHLRPYAGPAGRQRREAQQHQPAHDLALDLRAASRRRASGPASAAAGRASRSGCAGWPGHRSRWRCRTPEWAPRPAPRRRPRARSMAASASCVEHDRGAVAGDGDDLVEGERDRRRPAPRSGRSRERWSGSVGLMRRSNPQRGAAASPAPTASSRIRDMPARENDARRPRSPRPARAGRDRLRGTARAGLEEGAGRSEQPGHLDHLTRLAHDAGRAVGDSCEPLRSAEAVDQGAEAADTARPRPDPRRRHQLAAVPQGHGHPGEALGGATAARLLGAVRGDRPDQRTGLRGQPVPGGPGRLGQEPPPAGGGVLGDQRPDPLLPAAGRHRRGARPCSRRSSTSRP